MKSMSRDIYYRIAHNVADFLAKVQNEKGSFPARTFYAETFSLLLWSHFKDEFKTNIQRALDYYLTKDKIGDHLFPHSWEFNNYALLNYYLTTRDARVSTFLEDLKFEGIKVANWSLLRAACRLLKGGLLNIIRANLDLIKVLLLFQKNGFVFDEKGYEKCSKSFQYHCYSVALLGEIYGKAKREFIRKRFLQGVDYIIPFILPNGDTLYIGRGQEQIFGYGALIYALEYAHKITKNTLYKQKAEIVTSYLLKFQRKDGSFPLVLRDGEKGYPGEVDTRDDRFLGWYRYNSYFDYLSFLGYYLIKTDQIAIHLEDSNANHGQAKKDGNCLSYHDDEFLIYSNSPYTAVISRPGGYWANDMPLPYVCYKGESIFPCYGGEQRLESIYTARGIPLPFGISKDRAWGWRRAQLYRLRKIYYSLKGTSHFIHRLKKTNVHELVFRDLLKYKLTSKGLLGKSRYLDHLRTFEFMNKKITIEDKIIFKRTIRFEEFYPINYLFFGVKQIDNTEFLIWYKGLKGRLISSRPCYIERKGLYCARGKVQAVRERMERIKLERGDIITRCSTVEFH